MIWETCFLLDEDARSNVAEFQKPKDLMLFQQQLTAWQQAAAMATKAGTPFSTPMPQIPQSVIEEMQKKQAMDAAKKLLHLCKNRLQEQPQQLQDFGKDEWNRNSNSFWTLPQAILQQ